MQPYPKMQQPVYQVLDVDEQKQRLIDVWYRFKQSVIDDAVDEWRKCLYKWICVKGIPVENLI